MSMKISPEQRYRQDKWWLLQELRHRFLSADPHDMIVTFKLLEPSDESVPSKEVQRSLLEQLANSKTVSIRRQDDETYQIEYEADFNQTYNKYLLMMKDVELRVGEPITFDDDTGMLTLGNDKCQLPPFKYEHMLCQVMSQYLQNEPVDTSEVYEKMLGENAEWDDRARRLIKDTVRRINKRVNEAFHIPAYLKLEKNTIRRLR